MRILLAEDDLRLGPLIVHMLNKQGHTVDWVKDGVEALDYLTEVVYDLLIVDWMMPKMDGIALCKEQRNQGFHGGILLLTARDTVDNRVEGLDAGADDYLVKPFEFAELFARIRSLSRRITNPLCDQFLDVPPYQLNLTEHVLSCGQVSIPLTIREFQLMELLMRNQGKVLTRELLLDRIWGYDTQVTSNSLDALIKQLRKKLASDHLSMKIQNVRGLGYRLEVSNVCSNK